MAFFFVRSLLLLFGTLDEILGGLLEVRSGYARLIIDHSDAEEALRSFHHFLLMRREDELSSER